MSFCLHINSITFINSPVGMLDYILVIRKDANFRFRSKGISRKSFINCAVFFTLKVCGRGMHIRDFLESILANLYAGEFFQFTTGLMGGIFLVYLY
jgi:hypothetical protein